MLEVKQACRRENLIQDLEHLFCSCYKVRAASIGGGEVLMEQICTYCVSTWIEGIPSLCLPRSHMKINMNL